MVNKIFRVVLKMKYDVETIVEKLDQIEYRLNSSVSQTKENITYEAEENNFIVLLLIVNDDQFVEVENKLVQQLCRSSSVKIFKMLVGSFL